MTLSPISPRGDELVLTASDEQVLPRLVAAKPWLVASAMTPSPAEALPPSLLVTPATARAASSASRAICFNLSGEHAAASGS